MEQLSLRVQHLFPEFNKRAVEVFDFGRLPNLVEAAKGWPKFVTDGVTTLLRSKLDDLMVDDLSGWIVDALLKYFKVIAASREPGDGELFPLLVHAFSWKHEPKIQLLLNGQPTPVQLAVKLELRLDLEGAALRIKDARVVELIVGRLQTSGSIFLEQHLLAQRKLKPVSLGGSVSFPSGIPLTFNIDRDEQDRGATSWQANQSR